MNNRLSALVVVALGGAACGGGSDSVAIADFADQLREARCEALVRCGVADGTDHCLVANMAGEPYTSATTLAAISAGRIKFDGAAARRCLDAIAGRPCDVTDPAFRNTPPDCLAETQGTLPAGAACAVDGECISQACTIPSCTMACCPGTCAGDDPVVLVAAGESCETNLCDIASYCDPVSTTCVALKNPGDSCESGEECSKGLYCLPSTGTCGSLPSIGATCSSDGCSALGATCSLASRTCVKVGVLGDPCSSNTDCSLLYVCDHTQRCSDGLALGDPCTVSERCATLGAFCDVPDDTDTGSCVAPKPAGATCRTGFDCASHVCDPGTGTCVPDVACD